MSFLEMLKADDFRDILMKNDPFLGISPYDFRDLLVKMWQWRSFDENRSMVSDSSQNRWQVLPFDHGHCLQNV